MAYEALLEPVRIGSLELKNRIALAPMNMGYTGPMGYPSEDGLAYYSTRARGGFGLIITEASMINPHPWSRPDARRTSLSARDVNSAISISYTTSG